MGEKNLTPKKVAPKKRRRKVATTPDKTVSRNDDFGNRLICKGNNKRILLSIKLSDENRFRKVGRIDRSTRTLTVKRNENHLFWKHDSFGFNFQILDEAKTFDTVRILSYEREYRVPREKMLELGKFLHFKGQGFERQIFISRTALSEFARKHKF